MAVRITAWLEDTIATQLLLGNHWLQEKHTKKEQGVKCDPERDWRGLYTDNGSCLDITKDIHPDENSYLQIIQLSPLVFTDGQTHIEPRTPPVHLPYLEAPASLHAVVAVRKYTVRCASYGPPRRKLSVILHAIDWVGHVEGTPSLSITALQPVWSDDVLDIARQLHETRAAEDRRCLASNITTNDEADDSAPVMAGADDGESQARSQYAFGTQIAHPIRARPSADEPQVLGVKSLEPVLAGNTQREDIRNKASTARPDKQDHLLSLLAKAAMPNVTDATRTTTDGFARPAPCAPKEATEPRGSQLHTQLPSAAHRQPTHTQDKAKAKETVSSPSQSSRGTKRPRESEADPRRATNDKVRRPGPAKNDATPQTFEQDLQKLASECSWMRDFEFSREACKVPQKQAVILAKEQSWHKPLPGLQFPDGNVPIEILTNFHRFADENAALEGAPDSDEEMTEDPSPEDPSPEDPSQENLSPEDPVEEADPSSKLNLEATQDSHLPSSQVSWSQSPSPEPPTNLSSRFGQVLPPDSSFDPPEEATEQDIAHQISTSKSQAPIFIESSNEKEQSEPPSSPPVQEEPIILDDDMEMEESVPQGLGEDSVGGASEHPLSGSPPREVVVQVKQTPIMKGKNGQIITATASPQPGKHRSSGTSKNTSSGSIVYGTYNHEKLQEPTDGLSAPTSKVHLSAQKDVESEERVSEQQHHQESTTSMARNYLNLGHIEEPQPMIESESQQGGPITPSHPVSSEHVMNTGGPDVDMGDVITPEAPASIRRQQPVVVDELSKSRASEDESKLLSLPGPTPISAQVPLASPKSQSLEKHITVQNVETSTSSRAPSLTPGPTKRKIDDSPSRSSRRHSKRREIKIVGFGDMAPAAEDPTLAIRQHREESLRKFRESRRSSSSFEAAPLSTTVKVPQQAGEAMEVDSPKAVPTRPSPPAMSPRHVSLYEDPSPVESVQATAEASHAAAVPSPGALPQKAVAAAPPLTVFDDFRAAYPEYTGNAKHFQGQCNQVLKLDAEDKMVPKWQWDDYIIRSKIEYSAYLQECNDQGDDPEPYHRFYKNNIRPIYTKGIIEGPQTLTTALQQLGIQPPVLETPVPAPTIQQKEKRPMVSPVLESPVPATIVPQKEKRPRASLPSAFNKPSAPQKTHVDGTHHDRERARHSLPASTQAIHQTPAKTPHKSTLRTPKQPAPITAPPGSRKPNLVSRLSLDGAASSRAASVARDTPAEGTGDPFRDFYFAQKRLTSLSGSTKVDSRLPWPRNLAVRPSVAEALRGRKMDVLGWGDVL